MTDLPASPVRLSKSKYIIVVLIAALLITASATGSVWAMRNSVTLIVDGELSHIDSEAEDVEGLLAEAGITLSEGDLVNPDVATLLEDGMTVAIRHATPVTLMLGGEPLELTVVGSTVADVLVSVGLDPANGISVEPAVDTVLEPGMVVTATDVFLRVMQEEVEIPFETQTVNDPEMVVGEREVRTEGVPGRMLRIYEVVVTDGTEGARVLKAERVVTPVVDEVVVVGTRRVVAQVPVSRGSDREVAAAPASGTEMTVVTSAYTPGVGCGYSTATGTKAGFGVVAVDPSVIPLGTRMYIPGYGYGVAADTGGAIDGSRIDLCFDTLSEALSWGRRTVTITIVD